MQIVLITGSNRGIGFATAKKFLSEGWTVIGASRSGHTDIDNPNFHKLKLDITSDSEIKAAVDFVKEKFGQIDVLVNNAGIAPEPWSEEVVIDLVRKTIENNLVSVINFTEQLHPYIKEGGKILNLSSMMASLTEINSGSDVDSLGYRISKTGINVYTRILAQRLIARHIIVASVDPGWVKTDMGGPSALVEPEKPAAEIFALATTSHESGLFWREGKVRSW